MGEAAEKLLMAFINDAYQGSGKPKKSTALAMLRFVGQTEGLQVLVNNGNEKAIKAFKLPAGELERQRDQLLEALEAVIEWYDMEADHSIEPDFYKRMAACQKSEEMAREAIATARGEQSDASGSKHDRHYIDGHVHIEAMPSSCKTMGPTCAGCPDCGPVMGDAPYREMFGGSK